METQTKEVLKYLRKHRTITQLQAIYKLPEPVTRLASCIHRLKKSHKIRKEMIYKGKKNYAKYFLVSKFLFVIITLSAFCGCHDTRSFENARKIKCGMNIVDIENNMGVPHTYSRINDSTEKRAYVYDNPCNGMDKHIEVIYENGKAKEIKDSW